MSIIAIRCKKHHRDMGLPFQVRQIARDGDGTRAMRLLTAEDHEIVTGPWARAARPLRPGLYCQQCLNEGNRTPMDIDEADLPDLGLSDPPVLFIAPEQFEVDACLAALDTLHSGNGRHVHELPPIAAQYADDATLSRLRPSLRDAIQRNFLGDGGHLYQFQAEAIEAALDGTDVVVTTPTASGKTLTYLAPALDQLLQDPNSTALYLSPLVALTEDQLASISELDGSGTDWEQRGNRFSHYRVCRQLEIGRQKLTVARYDGSVSKGDRQHIRKAKPQYLLTTPDMLHMALLNGAFSESQWAYLFSGLRYVIVDELHTYRGLFGASFANLIRRLRRICRAHGVSPQFICTSATMVEPAATVEKLIGSRPIVVDGGEKGAPQSRRKFLLWYDGQDEDIRATSTQAKNLLLFSLRYRANTIAFARSISEINDIYRFTTAELRESNQSELIVSPFMRELKTSEKRQIIRDLKSGKIHAVISTTALSMGIDIGSLSVALIIGFPGSIAQLWQQAGRAGRAGEGLIVLIADTNPLDQFFVGHPEVLFDLSAEPVYCNPDNPYVVRGHLLCAAREMAISDEELAEFGPIAQDMIDELEASGMLCRDPHSHCLELSPEAAARFDGVPLRNLSFSVDVITEDRTETIVQVDAARAQRALHKYAHYQYMDRYFLVTSFDVDFKAGRGQILVKELERPEYTTTARLERQVNPLVVHSSVNRGTHFVHFGQIHSKAEVTGYYKVPLFTRNEPFVFQPLGMAAPPPLQYETHAFWLEFDEKLLAAFPEAERSAGLHSLAGAIRLATAVEELTDPSDIIAVDTMADPETNRARILIHDTTPGGVGIAEAASTKTDRILRRALQILDECRYCAKHPESRGCPYCVTAQYGDESTINRHIAIQLASKLLGIQVQIQ